MAKRRFEVTATDEQSDVWTYATDDRERAETMLADMEQDFGSAEMIDHGRGAGS